MQVHNSWKLNKAQESNAWLMKRKMHQYIHHGQVLREILHGPFWRIYILFYGFPAVDAVPLYMVFRLVRCYASTRQLAFRSRCYAFIMAFRLCDVMPLQDMAFRQSMLCLYIWPSDLFDVMPLQDNWPSAVDVMPSLGPSDFAMLCLSTRTVFFRSRCYAFPWLSD